MDNDLSLHKRFTAKPASIKGREPDVAKTPHCVVSNVFPTFAGCVRHFGSQPGKGFCFHRSAALVLDLGGHADLVIGTFQGETADELRSNPLAARQDFIHCWVETADGEVIAPTLYETHGDLFRMSRHDYYDVNGARDTKTLTRREVMKAFKGRGLTMHLRYGARLLPGKKFAFVLCDAAGVSVRDDGNGNVIPDTATPSSSHCRHRRRPT